MAYYLLAGGKTYSVPLVNNQPVATAEREITQQHLRSTVVDQANSSVGKGLVISSNPPQGNNVAANTLVTLYVSTGAAPVSVPYVVGQQETAAQSTLRVQGLPGLGQDRCHLHGELGDGGQPESQRRHGSRRAPR